MRAHSASTACGRFSLSCRRYRQSISANYPENLAQHAGAGSGEATVATGILRQILLVVFFRVVKIGRRQNLCRNPTKAFFLQRLLKRGL